MSNRINNGYYSERAPPMSNFKFSGRPRSYNDGIVIAQGGGPPPPMLTQTNPNMQNRQVLHQKGQYAMNERDITSLNAYPENLSGKRPMTIVDPLYDQHIIKPPKANVTQGRIPNIEFITSDDRNFRLYPTESDYVVHLKNEYKNVTSVTLFNASIPNTGFLIGERNNRIYIQESVGDTIAIELPFGDYTPALLQTALQTALNDAGDSTYTVTLDTLTNKYSIASDLTGGDHIFNLIFYGGSELFQQGNTRPKYIERSIGRVLGFPRKDFLYASGLVTTTAGSTTVIGDQNTRFTDELEVGEAIYLEDIMQLTSVTAVISDSEIEIKDPATASMSDVKIVEGTHNAPCKFDLSSEPFIVLEIPELENVSGNATHIDRAFAVIPMVFPHNTKNFVVSPASGIPPYKKFFNPPLPRLDRLTIRFRDIDGNLVNFNGITNFMEFRIITMNAPGFYDPGSIN